MENKPEQQGRTNHLSLGGVALLGTLLAPQTGLAQTSEDRYALPPSHIGEYMSAIRPRLDESEERPPWFEEQDRRFNVSDDFEDGLGRYVAYRVERGLGIDLPNSWRWRVTDDDVRGTGARIEVRIPLNPIERE